VTDTGWRHLLSSNHDLAKFWLGESVSLIGSSITTVALPLAAVYLLGANAGQLGLLRFAGFLPYALLTLFLGVWIDRRPRRPLMIGANAGRCVLIGLVPLLTVAGMLTMPTLYAVAVAVGTLTVLFEVSWMSFLPTIVNRTDLLQANSLVATSYAAAQVAGPGLAGTLVQLIAAPMALLVDAVSYLVSLTSLLFIHPREAVAVRPRQRLLTDALGSLRFIFHNPSLRAVALQAGMYNFFFQFVQVLFVLYAVRTLGFNPGLFGLILSAGAVGGLAGAVLAPALARRLRFGTLLVGAAVTACVPAVLIPLVVRPTAVAGSAMAIIFFVMECGVATVNVLSISLRQAVTPPDMLGRMNSGILLILYGTVPVGSLAAGFLGRTLGPRSALSVAGLGLLASLVPMLASRVPRLVRLDNPR
jgi:MFS family permease